MRAYSEKQEEPIATIRIPLTITPLVGKGVAADPPHFSSFGVDGLNRYLADTFAWLPGSKVTLSAKAVTLREVRTTFLGWSDGGAMTHTIVAPAGNASYVARFRTEFAVAFHVEPEGSGSVTPHEAGFYPGYTPIPIAATPSPGWAFDKWFWTGRSRVSGGAATTVVLSDPGAVVARFKPAGPPSLSWKIAGKTSDSWTLRITNNGPNAVQRLAWKTIAWKQVSGTPCEPTLSRRLPDVKTPSAPGASVEVELGVYRTGCPAENAYSLEAGFSANRQDIVQLTLPPERL
ncbi:MAG: hypothetical protein JNL98_12505 [Bryobacterales bacterium]|nr:hypothetical protein [Bryobacterales bacterium]